jgi:hypothetical protein
MSPLGCANVPGRSIRTSAGSIGGVSRVEESCCNSLKHLGRKVAKYKHSWHVRSNEDRPNEQFEHGQSLLVAVETCERMSGCTESKKRTLDHPRRIQARRGRSCPGCGGRCRTRNIESWISSWRRWSIPRLGLGTRCSTTGKIVTDSTLVRWARHRHHGTPRLKGDEDGMNELFGRGRAYLSLQ